MRIAFYAPLKSPNHPLPSGDRRMARLLMAALGAGGHEVTLVSELSTLDSRGLAARQAHLAATAATEIRRLQELWNACTDDRRPDAWFTYHVYYKAPDYLGPAMAKAFTIPYLVAEASHAPKRAGGPWDLGHRAAEAAISAADVVFYLTQLDRQCTAPLVAPPHRLIALPPFLDPGQFIAAAGQAPSHRRALAEAAGLDTKRPWIMVVAMMRARDKLPSYRQLGQALSAVKAGDWTLVVVGDGPARAEVEAALAPLGDAVRFLGAVEPSRLPALLAAADLYVWPAVGEAYGMAFLEAQAAGLPVIAGRHRGVPDVVKDGETAWLTDPNDVGQMANRIDQLLADPAKRVAMGQAACAFVGRERTLPVAARILDEALRWAQSCY